MTAERHQQIGELYQAALEQPAHSRAAWLAVACAGDDELRREVEALLAYQPQAASFIEQPAWQMAADSLLDEQRGAVIGRRLAHYEVRSLLGAGGMGEVYLAEDTRLGRKVALKLLPAAFTADAGRVRRFEQEARAASALNHPNILTIYDIGEAATDSGGAHYIATEFIDGATLRQRMMNERLPLNVALDVALQIAAALEAAHTAGIIHRDIKPENVMVRRDGIVKVLDFGLAKLTEREAREVDSKATQFSTEPGLVLGTATYMSPEQARGLKVDARSDIFSLGVMLYEMVAGRRPFEGATTTDVLAAILGQEPAPLKEHLPAAPAELQHIVTQALQKDREQRYQTVKDLSLDLKDLNQELEFEERGKGAQASARRAQRAEAVTNEAPAPTASAEDLVSGIRRRKRSLIAAVVALLALAVAGIAYYFSSARQIDSIAVLPLVNVSHDPETEYLSDGIAEALINSLTELQQLRVVARTTAFHYKGKEPDPQQVGRELKVRAVLTGQVRQRGETLAIQVDLVDTATGAELWGKEYERRVSDALSIKQAIAQEVTEKLRLRLSGAEQQRLIRRDATSAEAWQFYLRGRHFWNKRTADGLKKAIEQFQQAIDRDPSYALGYVGLADCYGLLELYTGAPASETLPKARAAADRALQLDDSLAEAHTSSAAIYDMLWRWAEAGEEFKRAISLNPNYPTAHHWYAHYLRLKGQFDDALREIERAQELDPLAPAISQYLAEVYLAKNEINAAIEQCRKIIELDPGFPNTYATLGVAYLKQRRYEEAAAALQKAVELSGRASVFLSHLGYCQAVAGRRAEALAILKELEERYSRRASLGQYLAIVNAGLGAKDQAFAWLERDFQQRSGELARITTWFYFEDLHRDPRYADLVRRMGLNP